MSAEAGVNENSIVRRRSIDETCGRIQHRHRIQFNAELQGQRNKKRSSNGYSFSGLTLAVKQQNGAEEENRNGWSRRKVLRDTEGGYEPPLGFEARMLKEGTVMLRNLTTVQLGPLIYMGRRQFIAR